MGRCIVPLPLYGTARVGRTDARDNCRQLVRLCDLGAASRAEKMLLSFRSLESTGWGGGGGLEDCGFERSDVMMI